MRSFVLSGDRELAVPGVFKLRFSMRGWLASSVLMDAARFLVIGPRGESGARFGGFGALGPASLARVAMAGWLEASSVGLERKGSRGMEVSTAAVMEGANGRFFARAPEPDGTQCSGTLTVLYVRSKVESV